MKNFNESNEALGVLPMPASPQHAPGSGVLADIPYRQNAVRRPQPTFNDTDVQGVKQQRPQRRAVSTIAEIRDLLTDIKDQIQTAHDSFEDRKANTKAEADALQGLREQVAELERQKQTLEAKISEIERRGTPTQELIERAQRIEGLVSSAGKLLLEHFVDARSQELFRVPAEKLHKPVRDSLAAAFQWLNKFTTRFYAQLGMANVKTEKMAQNALDRCWTGVEELQEGLE